MPRFGTTPFAFPDFRGATRRLVLWNLAAYFALLLLSNLTLPLWAIPVLNPLCFAPPKLGSVGPRQYSYLGGPAYFNSDLTIFKNFHVFRKQPVQFRAAMFNFLNHPLRQFTSTATLTPTFNTLDKVTFTSTMVNNLSSYYKSYVGTPDQKEGRRLGELSVKYNF